MAYTYPDYTQGSRLESQGAQGYSALHFGGPAVASHGPDAWLQQLPDHHRSGAARARLPCLSRLLAARTLPHLPALSRRSHTYHTTPGLRFTQAGSVCLSIAPSGAEMLPPMQVKRAKAKTLLPLQAAMKAASAAAVGIVSTTRHSKYYTA